ncbi:MAG: type II secretion system protein GspG [Planctomycetota bacterium]
MQLSLKLIFLLVTFYCVLLGCWVLIQPQFCLVNRRHVRADMEIRLIRRSLQHESGRYLERAVELIRREGRVDPWGHEYQLVKRDEGVNLCWHVYSFGEDGRSKSNGNDQDDINTWNYSVSTYYAPKIKQQQRIDDARVAIWLAVPFFLVLAWKLLGKCELGLSNQPEGLD